MAGQDEPPAPAPVSATTGRRRMRRSNSKDSHGSHSHCHRSGSVVSWSSGAGGSLFGGGSRSGSLRGSGAITSNGPLSLEFAMHDIDISQNYGHGTVPVPGRESHTADLEEFDRYVKIMEDAERLDQELLAWDDNEDDYDELDEIESFDGSVDGSPPEAIEIDRVTNQMRVSILDIDDDDDHSNNDTGRGEEGERKCGSIGLESGPSFGLKDNGADNGNGTPLHPADGDSPRPRYPFNPAFWRYVRSILSNASPVGFEELPDPNATSKKTPEDATKFITKVISIGPLNPIQPSIVAEAGGFDVDVVLGEPCRGCLVAFGLCFYLHEPAWFMVKTMMVKTSAWLERGPKSDSSHFRIAGDMALNGSQHSSEPELFYGTLVGLVAMRFAPECVQCGSAVMDTDMLGRIPGRALCNGCNAPNVVDSMDKIKVMFLLNSDVLYILAENYACTPSSESMSVTSVFAAVPANSTGSGYSYCVGTGEGTEISPVLAPGRYRMHCPVAKTDNYLVVKREANDKDEPVELNMKVSDLVYKHRQGQMKAELQALHGKIQCRFWSKMLIALPCAKRMLTRWSFHHPKQMQVNIFPDTRSFFVLWVQKDADDKTLMHLPQEQRPSFTSAADVIHHPIFNSLFQENQVVSVQKNVFLSISNVVLVFTDIVDSTKLYAALGDGEAFQLVRKHFQVLFGAFTSNGGRVVKTIGDAVMGSFTTGRAALTAVRDAMELLPTIGRRPDNNNHVEIRVGIHSGQATVVPLNGVNDYFGQTANIAARVQSVAKASECFVTETVLESSPDAREAYEQITRTGSAFKATPITELSLKGVEGKVQARGFRWLLMSRRMSEGTRGSASYYMDRTTNRHYSLRMSAQSMDSGVSEESSSHNQSFRRPAERGRRKSNLDAHCEEN
ncbi:hypothetical protein ACHAWF_008652 [Thalassiosira exigua]